MKISCWMLNVLINFHTNCIGQIKKSTFAKNNIKKNVKERVLFKNYKVSEKVFIFCNLQSIYIQ